MATTTQSGLMKKTKAELVNIILRKDDVEAKASVTIDDLNKSLTIHKNLLTDRDKTINKMDKQIKDLTSNLKAQKHACEIAKTNNDANSTLISNYQAELDNNASIITTLKNKIYKLNIGLVCTSFVILGLIIGIILA